MKSRMWSEEYLKRRELLEANDLLAVYEDNFVKVLSKFAVLMKPDGDWRYVNFRTAQRRSSENEGYRMVTDANEMVVLAACQYTTPNSNTLLIFYDHGVYQLSDEELEALKTFALMRGL